MSTAIFSNYSKTLITAAILLAALMFGYSDLLSTVYVGLEPVFMWSETTWFGYIGKNYGGIFAVIQAVHLLSMAVLGGAVIAGDGRVLGIVLRDVPVRTVVDRAHRIFVWALIVVVATGIFMACGVASKIYFLPVYWFKMLSLGAGTLFHFFIRRPLLRHDINQLNPIVVKMVAIASILVWFMVAATGRWIGFSG